MLILIEPLKEPPVLLKDNYLFYEKCIKNWSTSWSRTDMTHFTTFHTRPRFKVCHSWCLLAFFSPGYFPSLKDNWISQSQSNMLSVCAPHALWGFNLQKSLTVLWAETLPSHCILVLVNTHTAAGRSVILLLLGNVVFPPF